MGRLKYIDSLRGIAALIVVVFHMIDVFFFNFQFGKSENQITNIKIAARSIFNGSDWVSFFFVLSGFSLSLYYLKNQVDIDLKNFYMKRFFRVYPLYILVLLVTFFVVYPHTSWSSLSSQALLFNFRNELIPPSWSLSIEWIGSLLIPFFILIFRYNKRYFYTLTVVSLFFYNGIGHVQSSFFGFTFNFLLGIILADLYLNNRLKLPKNYYFFIFPFILLSFTSRWLIDFFPLLKYLIHLFTDLLNMDFHQIFYYFSAIASFLLLFVVLQNQRIQRILSYPAFVFLGTISFSIYLIHFLVIKLFFNQLAVAFDFIENELLHSSLTVVSLLLTVIGISTFTYFLVEKPFIDFVKKWNKK
jgi:peptidoglycan/LPS O-acetylase OafA/YrhL